jgi:hypothetical protein
MKSKKTEKRQINKSRTESGRVQDLAKTKYGRDQQFARRIYECLESLGAKSDLLSTVNSWRKSLSDEECIFYLDCYLGSVNGGHSL